MKLQALIITMNHHDFDIYNIMHLSSDAVIANQCGRNETISKTINGHRVKFVFTDTKGASRNRNIALANSFQDDDLILFSDDDLIFNDNYETEIVEEFLKHPYADAIKFNLHDCSKSRQIAMQRIRCFEKATRRNMAASGVWGLVIKKKVLDRLNLRFREDFGPGVNFYYKGEDTIFLQHLLNDHIRFYRSPIDIAGINQASSSWFKGYDEQFFIVSGAVLAACYPRLCRLISIKSAYSSWKRKNSHFSLCKLIKLYYRGVDRFFNEWKQR